MYGEDALRAIAERALAASQAEQTHVIVTAENSALTRFANNMIHQNVSEQNLTVVISAVDGNRIGSAETNAVGDDQLRQAAAQALAHARQQPDDPEFPGLARPQPFTHIDAFDEATAAISPAERAAAVGSVCRLSAEKGLTAAGSFHTQAFELYVANTNGVRAYHPWTAADLQTVVMGADGSGRAQASSRVAAEIDSEAIAREAVEGALRVQGPQAIEPGEYTVVLAPYAVHDIVVWLALSGMGAEAVQEGRSWMSGRTSQQLMSPQVSIWDDGLDIRGIPQPFDHEGVPREKVPLIENGVPIGPVYDLRTAAKDSRPSTGHGLPPGARWASPVPRNIFMAEGNQSTEELIRSTKRGLYITRFWYTRLVHPRECILTGMTRDGVLLIEDGELRGPVKNLRFTQSYVAALAHAHGVSSETRLITNEWGLTARVPALKIDTFNFTGVTV